MSTYLKLLAFAFALPAMTSPAAAAKCGFDVMASAREIPGSKTRVRASDFRAQIESTSGHWLKDLAPSQVKLIKKGRGGPVYGLRFDISDGKFCRGGLLIKLSGYCYSQTTNENGKFGASINFDIWLTGRKTPSLERSFKVEVCR